jgi:uncharacterized protein
MMTLPFQLLKRAAFTVTAALALTTSALAGTDFTLYGDTLMWRLEPPGGGAPSYMVGTMHLVEPRLEPAIDRALERLRETGALVVETDLAGASGSEFSTAMMLTDGRALPDIIGEDEFARLLAIVEPYGIPESAASQYAPWGATLLVSMPADQVQHQAAGEAEFDQRLVDAAAAWALPVDFLEPIAEQIAVFADHPEQDQVAMLASALDLYPELDALTARMIDAYVADDLTQLADVVMRRFHWGDEALTARMVDMLITDRNQRMAERVIPMLEAHPHLVAIGAMHLPGPDGVLNLLAEQGWTVVPAEE